MSTTTHTPSPLLHTMVEFHFSDTEEKDYCVSAAGSESRLHISLPVSLPFPCKGNGSFDLLHSPQVNLTGLAIEKCLGAKETTWSVSVWMPLSFVGRSTTATIIKMQPAAQSLAELIPFSFLLMSDKRPCLENMEKLSDEQHITYFSDAG